MADYIDRQELLKQVLYDGRLGRAYDTLKKIANDMPAADVQKVVRCADCKHRDRLNNACLYPFIKDEEDNLYHKIVEDTDFCKWGEKE